MPRRPPKKPDPSLDLSAHLLPLGSLIDLQMYHPLVDQFLKYRIAGSLAMIPLLLLVHAPSVRRHHAA